MISIAEVIETIQICQRRGWLRPLLSDMVRQIMECYYIYSGSGKLRPDGQLSGIKIHLLDKLDEMDKLHGWSVDGIFYGFINGCEDPIVCNIIGDIIGDEGLQISRPLTLELLAYGLSRLDHNTIDWMTPYVGSYDWHSDTDMPTITFEVEGSIVAYDIVHPEYLKREFRSGCVYPYSMSHIARVTACHVLDRGYASIGRITDFKVYYEVMRAVDYLMYVKPS